MKLDYNNDAYKDEKYPDYVARKKNDQVGFEIGVFVLKTVYQVLRFLIIYSPLLYLGFRFTEYSFGEGLSELSKTSVLILVAFILYTFIYFIKGLLIGLKEKEHKLWSMIWLLCVLITCVLPAYFVQGFLETLVDRTHRSLPFYQTLTWGGAVLFAFYTYSAYKFRTPQAPKMVRWSYSLGNKLVK